MINKLSMRQEEIPVMAGQILEKSNFRYFLAPDSMWMVLDHVYALQTWYVLLEHGTCSWNMVYSLGTWYMVLGHGICFLDMDNASWTWTMLS